MSHEDSRSPRADLAGSAQVIQLDAYDYAIIIASVARLELDAQADAAYLSLSTGQDQVAETVPVLEWLNLDLDRDGRLIGLEILGASSRLRLSDADDVVALAGTREAAEIFGVRPSNFIRDYTTRPDFPAPLASLAGTRVWDCSHLIAYRQGRRTRMGKSSADQRPAHEPRQAASAAARGHPR